MSGETAGTVYFFFFLATVFFFAARLTLDLLAITLSFYWLTCLRNTSFSEGCVIMLVHAAIVNARHQIHLA